MEYLQIRPMRLGEEEQVAALAIRVFNTYVAPLYSTEGVAEFSRYANSDAMALRLPPKHFTLVAEHANKLIGMIEIRNHTHVSMLFVDDDQQRKGIGRKLLKEALSISKKSEPTPFTVTVNASPNAIDAYKKFGFFPQGNEQTINGIRFTPMILKL